MGRGNVNDVLRTVIPICSFLEAILGCGAEVTSTVKKKDKNFKIADKHARGFPVECTI